MLIEESEKFYDKLAKELGNEIRSDIAYNISSPSLPLLPHFDEKEQQTRPLLQNPPEGKETCQHSTNGIQEDRFIQSSRIYNDDEDKEEDNYDN